MGGSGSLLHRQIGFSAASISLATSILCLLVGCGGGGSVPDQKAPQSESVLPADAGRVFALLNPGDSSLTAARFAAMPDVSGLAFRDRWSLIETRQGVLDWTRLDAITDLARQANKRLTLHIAADTPSWLGSQGVQFYSYTNQPGIGSGSAPIPWDRTFLSLHASFINALATHLKARGDHVLIDAVSVGAPVAEMSLPACSNGQLGPTNAYSRSAYLEAWTQSIESHRSAFDRAHFPNIRLLVSAPVNQICRPDQDGANFYRELMVNQVSADDRIGVFMADLNALGSNRLTQVDTTLRTRSHMLHFQTLWSAADDPDNRFQGVLLQGTCASWRSGARYLELYQADLDNAATDASAAILAARTGQGC